MSTSISVLKETEILGQSLTVYGDLENPTFLAKDVAAWISHSDVSTMVRTVDEDEKLVQTMFVSGQNRDVMLLTENGVYEVLMQSRKPVAKQFKKGVKEILNSIRKHGAYLTPSKTEELIMNPELIISMAQTIKTERSEKERLLIENEKQANALKVSAKKVAYHDQVLDTPDLFTISTIANELGFRSPFALNTYLHEKGVLKRVGGVWLLTANFVGLGYTGPKTHTHVDSDGKQHSTILTCWTQKGREFIHAFYAANPPSVTKKVLKPFTNNQQVGSVNPASI